MECDMPVVSMETDISCTAILPSGYTGWTGIPLSAITLSENGYHSLNGAEHRTMDDDWATPLLTISTAVCVCVRVCVCSRFKVCVCVLIYDYIHV